MSETPDSEASPPRRHPDWIRVRAPSGEAFHDTKRLVRDLDLHTVCEEAHCPNIGECWGHRTATFMLLGDVCTRNCSFCAVAHGRPVTVDPHEPLRVAEGVARLGLRHVVVTSVDRDDLADGGAQHFAATARAIKRLVPECAVEVLVPDFQGLESAVDAVVDSPIDIFNHNTETVPRLYRRARAGGRYERTLRVLQRARERQPGLLTKTGMMLGIGERRDELLAAFADLRAVDCNILTLGQYLRPSKMHLHVERYLTPDEFAELRREAELLGFRHVESGPLVRSSYHAWQHVL
jgi:lipoic acid synthetase